MSDTAAIATLTLTRSSLIHQETVRCEASLTNLSDGPLNGVNRDSLPGYPLIELTPLDGREPTWHTLAPPAGSGVEPVNLRPEDEMQVEFRLDEILTWPGPGQYELKAVYEWGGGAGRAESEPVPVEVRGSSPRSVAMFPDRGGWSDSACAAWVSPVDPFSPVCEVCFSLIAVSPEPRVTHVESLTVLPRLVKPIPSIPPNGTIPSVHWIAWMDGSSLLYARTGTSELGRLDMPGRAPTLLPPLLSSPDSGTAEALLFDGGRLLVMEIGVEGARARLAGSLMPGALRWAQAICTAEGVRMCFLLTAEEGGGSRLWRAEWTAAADSMALSYLLTCDCSFAAAGLLAARNGAIHGAILTGDHRILRWSQTPAGECLVSPEVTLLLPSDERLDPVVIRVSETGEAYTAMRGAGGAGWWVAGPGGRALRMRLNRGELVDILFRSGEDPVLVWADPAWGFRFTGMR
jgi:hypothetical protein